MIHTVMISRAAMQSEFYLAILNERTDTDGATIYQFFNTSEGCKAGDGCPFLHVRVVPFGAPLMLRPRPWRSESESLDDDEDALSSPMSWLFQLVRVG